ncbi:MAG TPA: YgiT-type zinc finger protein [Anaerolineaceae bacterium]|nr:YgiT-type zinc finger protein [Anaerolineaceae bacterium]
MTDKNPDLTLPCNECQAGQMHRQFITYFTWLGDELITVMNFPAWVCDVCGKREYDPQAVSRLNLLLNPNAGRPSRTPRITPHQPRKSARPTSLE